VRGKSTNHPENKKTIPDSNALSQARHLAHLSETIRAEAIIPTVYTARKFAQGMVMSGFKSHDRP
jgi:hypothetical protein